MKAIEYPRCGSEAWKRREIERMLDNDAYDAQHAIPLPTIPDALRFRSDQMGWNDSMMAGKLGMGRSHYSEVLSGKRPLPLSAIRKAYALGVPASVLLQPEA